MRKVIFLVLFLISCSNKKQEVILKIGNREIGFDYLDYKLKIDYIRGSKKPDTIFNLLLLIEEILTEEIGKKEGLKVDQKMLKEEKERIDKETLLPEVLERIKKIYKSEEEYLEYFIKPIVYRQFLPWKFYLDTIYHLEDYNYMKELLRKIKNNDTLVDTNLVKTFVYKPKEESINYYLNIYKEDTILQDRYTFFIVKWDSNKRNIKFYRKSKKKDYYGWWREKALKFKVKVYNKRYLELLIKKTEEDTFYLKIFGVRK